jgi:hypothetical protein
MHNNTEYLAERQCEVSVANDCTVLPPVLVVMLATQLIDSGKLPITSYASQHPQQQQQQQQQHEHVDHKPSRHDLQLAGAPDDDAAMDDVKMSPAAAAASHPYPTGPALPASSHHHHQQHHHQQQQQASMASLASSHDHVLQHSHSIISSATAPTAGSSRRHHHSTQQQQQQASKPAAYMQLAVRCGTAHGVFDITRCAARSQQLQGR